MPKRSYAFFTSLIIHALILFGAYYLYISIKAVKEEKRVVIKLCQCQSNTQVSRCECGEQRVIEQKKEPITKQAVVSNVSPTKEIVKTVEIPKEIAPKIEQKIEQNVEKKEIAQSKSVEVTTSQTQPSKEQPIAKAVETPKAKSVENSATLTKEYVRNNLSEIRRLLQENLYYPLSARKRAIQGRVVVKFTLLKNGEIKNIIITQEATDILNDAAIKTVTNLSKKMPVPSEELTLEIPINYQLH